MALVEVDACIYDELQLARSFGFESLDPVGREAFVNHMHINGEGRHGIADRIIESWAAEMRSRWPGQTFRIYKDSPPDEVIIRFHRVRPGISNWCEEGVEIIMVDATEPPCAIACPACGGRLVEVKAKLVCSRCRAICETCCEGGRG
jgi:hypothetical protein